MHGDDEAAFEAFAIRAMPRLLRTAWLLTGDAGRAEDAVQESLVRLYGVWSRVRHEAPEPYAHRILRNVVVSTWRRNRRLVLVPEVREPSGGRVSPGTTNPAGVTDRLDLVRALAFLPPREREVVVLRHYADLSERAVADALGVSLGTVKSSSSRGLERLRLLMSDQGGSHVR